MLTQCVRMTGKFFFEFEKKNLLIASKAPQCLSPLESLLHYSLKKNILLSVLSDFQILLCNIFKNK